MRSRRSTSRPTLRQPIRFVRRLPTGNPKLSCTGIDVEVIIRPDLHVIVLLNHSLRVGVTGRFSFHTVCWDESASAEFPAASLAMLAADVCDCIALFQAGELAACDWTDIPEALAQLGPPMVRVSRR